MSEVEDGRDTSDDVTLSVMEAAETLQGLAENLKDLAMFLRCEAGYEPLTDWSETCDKACRILDAMMTAAHPKQAWDVWLALASSIVASVAHSVREAGKETGR